MGPDDPTAAAVERALEHFDLSDPAWQRRAFVRALRDRAVLLVAVRAVLEDLDDRQEVCGAGGCWCRGPGGDGGWVCEACRLRAAVALAEGK